ncbi:putative dolichyl-phosphate beta-glucosyltransferase [Frankia alni ACN14a]|uniref:dolichyl-phosphate beta-glucosyltransferase n=1 Tax=Frankia alni (strain DSM 45986 / CECT 9034 / ACN14a) TaxID=326424 RepID=Q0RIN7_FRAAA|nr:putative dolichyl-phosphate beta-glucosyltransferase [Frankia alni ACN14a]
MTLPPTTDARRTRTVAPRTVAARSDFPQADFPRSHVPRSDVPRFSGRPAAAQVDGDGRADQRVTQPNPRPPRPDHPVLDLVVPVYNEERDLGPSVRRLHAFLLSQFPYPFRITIADNASPDETLKLARTLAAELPGVAVIHLDLKGRGRALREVWSGSDADVLAYTDVDLSTDLGALLPLVAPLISGHSDVAVGSRLSRGARVVRGPKREIISRCYNLLLRRTLRVRFRDAQCGFKAIRSDVAAHLLPHVADTGWFFDTELLVLAERCGLRVHEVPVDWVDDPDSRVDIVATALADLRGIVRLRRAIASGTVPVAHLRSWLGRRPLAPNSAPTAPLTPYPDAPYPDARPRSTRSDADRQPASADAGALH